MHKIIWKLLNSYIRKPATNDNKHKNTSSFTFSLEINHGYYWTEDGVRPKPGLDVVIRRKTTFLDMICTLAIQPFFSHFSDSPIAPSDFHMYIQTGKNKKWTQYASMNIHMHAQIHTQLLDKIPITPLSVSQHVQAHIHTYIHTYIHIISVGL